MKKLIPIFVFLCLGNISFSQDNQEFWVFFKDKKGVTFNPYNYFDEKAIERRQRQGLSLFDITDYPLKEEYVNQILTYVDSITGSSRWLNGVYVHGNVSSLEKIVSLPFVREVLKTRSQSYVAEVFESSEMEGDFELTDIQEGLLDDQVDRLGASEFWEKGYNGKGIRVAILDAGFPGVDVHPAFEHIRKENRLIDTYDFVKKRPFVYKYSSHGTSVMSCIGGKYGSKYIGLAPQAEFLLARTEKSNAEPFAEEKYWLAAVEWADKNGADIINSSLAYTYHRYFTTEMDGKTSLVSKAARIATRKGILVVNAAGNDGDDAWKIIATPADVDSVLTVGGINPYTDYHMDFSSFGPTANKEMKPNVCAYAQVIAADKEGMKETFGTSFAAPLIAGYAACVWQFKREAKNMEIFEMIEKSAHLYPYYDYAHGYGIPEAKNIVDKREDVDQAFEVEQDKFVVRIMVDEFFGDSTMDETLNNAIPKTDSSENINNTDSGDVQVQIVPDVEFQLLQEALIKEYTKAKDDYLYYHIQDKNGFITYYSLIEVYQYEALRLDRDLFTRGSKLIIHYKGFTKTISF
ncbi:MAG: S8 family serine peptidase [Flavobacteriales bacterium]|nr:S8 family serine peptidase [Flavobacteriales bacterium]